MHTGLNVNINQHCNTLCYQLSRKNRRNSNDDED